MRSSRALAVVVVLLVALGIALPAVAAEDAPEPPHHHPASWYGGWSLVLAGGAATLVGTALTTRSDESSTISGWVMASVGTATWIGGAVILRLAEKRREKRVAY
jgi:uncharacterized membrane protein YgdD (TMEM256/DUF423 family)